MKLPPKVRHLAVGLTLTGCSLFLVLIAVEVVVRLVPGLLPAGLYGSGRLDPNLGMNVHGGPLLYNVRSRVLKVANGDGFMDRDHEVAKPPGVTRLGIFGDSYVEALQVPHEATFFHLTPGKVGQPDLESFGFGVGGWGTLHSLINCRRQAPRYGIDVVVYAFVENDLGDNDVVLQRRLGGSVSPKPYAELLPSGEAYEIRWLRRPEARPIWFAPAKWAQTHSRVAQVVWDRILRLRKAGLTTQVRDATDMSEVAGDIPNSNALPSSWKPEDATRAQRLGRLLLRDWRDEMRAQERDFLVLYIPRSEAMLRGDYGLEATWRPWLGETCADLGISLIDPSDALRHRMRSGERVYDDHLTAAGHEAVAMALAEALRPILAAGAARAQNSV